MLSFDKSRKIKIVEFFAFSALFLGLFIFYTRVHAYYPWLSDDWGVLSGFSRNTALPFGVTGPAVITPSRVTPDIIGVIFGYLGAFVIYPLSGDYVYSLMLSTAIFLSGIITTLFVEFYLLLRKLSANRVNAAIGTVFVLLFSFMFLKSRNSNWYFFEAVCTCDVFYYMGTVIWSFILIFYDIRRRVEKKAYSLDIKFIACAIPLIYYSAMTVIIPNIPLFIYVTLILFHSIIKRLFVKSKERLIWRDLLKSNWTYFLYYLCFFVHAILEYASPRAGSYKSQGFNIIAQMKAAVIQWYQVCQQFNRLFVIVSAASVLLALLIFIHRKTRRVDADEVEKRLVFWAAFFLVFTIAVSFATVVFSGVSNININSMLLIVAPFLSLFVLIVLCIIYVCKTIPRATAIVPLAATLLLVPMLSSGLPLADSAFFTNTTAEQRYELMTGYIAKIKQAVDNGESEVVLPLPPEKFWQFGSFADTLNKHNIIDRYIDVKWE